MTIGSDRIRNNFPPASACLLQKTPTKTGTGVLISVVTTECYLLVYLHVWGGDNHPIIALSVGSDKDSRELLPGCRCRYPGRLQKCQDCPRYQSILPLIKERASRLQGLSRQELENLIGYCELPNSYSSSSFWGRWFF